jgi:hypothetical protein
MRKTFGIVMIALAAVPVAAQEKGWLARETAREYREQARFPESSRALKPGDADPVREKRTATEQTQRGPEDRGPALSVRAESVSFEVGKPIRLYATVDNGIALEVTGEIVGAAGDLVASYAYSDDGRGIDKKAGDGIWSARVLDGDIRESVGGFLYSNPAAHLTGRYRDQLRDGSLAVAAEVDVTRAGRFHLAATLYSMAGEPVGTAQAAAELEPGRRWIELSFYGLMFHDRKVAGPFRLGTVSLATTGGMPNALNDLVENAWVTRAWKLEQMTTRPFGNPRLLEAASRLEKQ